MLEALAAFLCALPVGMGVGGAGLYVIFLGLYEKMPQAQAQGANYLFFLFATAAGTVMNIRSGLIDKKAMTFLSFWGIFGALPGALLAFYLPSGVLRIFFAVFMIALGVYGIFRERRK